MVRLDKLLDAWRADPRVDATVELGSMLLRASAKAPGALPRTFVTEFGDEAAGKHSTQLGVLDVLSRLFALSGEGARAQALYARAASLFPGDARVSELEKALRDAGLAVPPPAVAAKLAPPPPPPEAPSKKDLPPPRAHAGSLADFAPAAIEARRLPIDESLLASGPPTATGAGGPDHVPEVPTRELESSSIEAAIGDESIPRRPRAPTVAGLGIPAPMTMRGHPPVEADRGAAPPPAAGRPVPQRRNKTLVPDAGLAPPAFAIPALPHLRPAADESRREPGPALEPASPVRMFTPVRAFTPPPGGLMWSGSAAGSPPARPLEEDASDGDTATGVMTPERRRQAIIDSPTTTQETVTRPERLAPRAADASPPTQTRLVPEEAQLRAAAASLVGAGRTDAGLAPPGTPSSGASRPAARRAVPARERRPVPELEDDPPTGVTGTETNVSSPPAGALEPLPQHGAAHSVGDGDGGPATARRDTSELLAAALRPAVPGAPPALGSPSAAATAPNPPVAPPPRMAQPSSPDGVSTLARTAPIAPQLTRPPSGPQAKPTLVSRGASSGPPVKPTLVSAGARAPGAPAATPPHARPGTPRDGDGAEPTGRLPSPPLPPQGPSEEPSHADEVDTRVRPLAPPAPAMTAHERSAAPAARPPASSSAFWDTKHPPVQQSTFDPRRELDDDGPSTNIIAAGVRGGPPGPPLAPRVMDEPSVEELSADAIEILGPVAQLRPHSGDPQAGKLDARAARSTQKLGGTVAPAVVWSPAVADDGEGLGGVRTKVLTVEESWQAGRIDPLPARDEAWMITPPPPVAPRFGPPPSLPPSSQGFGPGSMPSSSLQPPGYPSGGMPPGSQGYGSPGPGLLSPGSMSPRSLAPTFGPPSAVPPRPPAPSLIPQTAPRRTAASPIVVGSIVGVALSLLVAGGAWLYEELSHSSTSGPTAAAQTADAEALVLAGSRADLDRADALLREAPPRSAEKDRAMTRLRERAVRAIELGSTSGLDDAVTAARSAGWSEAEVAFAPLARAVADRDLKTGGALAQKWSGPRATDAFFMLAAAAAAEQRGDRKSLELYGAALGLEPRLRPAALRVARGELLEGREDRGVARVEALASQGATTPELAALRGVAWLRARREAGASAKRPAGPLPTPEELPVELRFVPDAVRLAAGELEPAARKAAVEAAVARADTPAVAVLVGELAFELRLEATALDIGRKQLLQNPGHMPSLALFAKSALSLAKLDELETVANGLPLPQQNHLRAVVAYERGDVAAVVQTRAWLGDRDEPGREAIVARAERLAGRRRMPNERVLALGRPDVVGGDLVAVDALLDAGDMAAARVVVDGWGDATSHPLRALRAARLFRYEGKLAEAEAALDAAVPTRPALIERVLLEAETAEGRTHARSMLDRGFGEDRALYEAYLLALDGKVPAARQLLDGTELPGDDAPLARRVAAALALGAVADEERGRDRVRRLAADWPANPDVLRAARSLQGAEGETRPSRPPPRPPPRPRRR